MRYALICGLLLFGAAEIDADEAEDRTQIQSTRQQWLKAYFKGDTDTLGRLESDEFSLITRNIVSDKKSQIAGIQQRMDSSDWLPPDIVNVDVDVKIRFVGNNVAVFSGHVANDLPGTKEQRSRLAVTEVWRRTDQGWRIAHLHFHVLDDSNSATPQSRINSRAKTFIDNTRDKPPHENLVKALQMFADEFDSTSKQRRLVAADLGAGAGNETTHLIQHGWDVMAVDIEPYAIQVIKERYDSLRDSPQSTRHGTLLTRLSSMQAMSLESDSLDLINASLSLPFVSQDQVKEVWANIVKALKPGGVFTGHFFGPERVLARVEGIVNRLPCQVSLGSKPKASS